MRTLMVHNDLTRIHNAAKISIAAFAFTLACNLTAAPFISDTPVAVATIPISDTSLPTEPTEVPSPTSTATPVPAQATEPPPSPAPPLQNDPLTNLVLTIPSEPTDLGLSPDPGLRVDYAHVPNAGIDPATGTVHLYYANDRGHPTLPDRMLHATAADGLIFGGGAPYDTFAFDSRNTLLPDGTWRRYVPPLNGNVIGSMSSIDGVQFTEDAGARYILHESDNGWMGVNTVFTNSLGDVVWIYLGDKAGRNNARVAYSTDGGDSFEFLNSNVIWGLRPWRGW